MLLFILLYPASHLSLLLLWLLRGTDATFHSSVPRFLSFSASPLASAGYRCYFSLFCPPPHIIYSFSSGFCGVQMLLFILLYPASYLFLLLLWLMRGTDATFLYSVPRLASFRAPSLASAGYRCYFSLFCTPLASYVARFVAINANLPQFICPIHDRIYFLQSQKRFLMRMPVRIILSA